jgi:hypothetical protein
MKPLLRQFPESISKLVEVYSSSDIKSGVLKKYFSMEVLPICLGGSNQNVDVREHFEEFARAVEEYTAGAVHALRQGLSIKEWEMMATYGVDRDGVPVSELPLASALPTLAADDESPSAGGIKMMLPTRRDGDTSEASAEQQQVLWSRTLERTGMKRASASAIDLHSSGSRLVSLSISLCEQLDRNLVFPDDVNLLLLQTEKIDLLIRELFRLCPSSRRAPVHLPPVCRALYAPAFAKGEDGVRLPTGPLLAELFGALREDAKQVIDACELCQSQTAWVSETARRALKLWPCANSWSRVRSAAELRNSAILGEAPPLWITADHTTDSLSLRCGGDLLTAVVRKAQHAWTQMSSAIEEYRLSQAQIAVLSMLVSSGTETASPTVNTTSRAFLEAVEAVHRAGNDHGEALLADIFPTHIDLAVDSKRKR